MFTNTNQTCIHVLIAHYAHTIHLTQNLHTYTCTQTHTHTHMYKTLHLAIKNSYMQLITYTQIYTHIDTSFYTYVHIIHTHEHTHA